jgi:hypothetical protein
VKSVILLTIWLLWKTRNEVIFKELTPNRQDLIVSILEEAKLWILAGAKELRHLPLHSRPPDGSLSLFFSCSLFALVFLSFLLFLFVAWLRCCTARFLCGFF